MANKINITISAQDKASAEIKKTQQALNAYANDSEKASTASRALGFAANAAKIALVATGVSAIAAGRFAVMSAADYEQSLNIFASVSGATAEQMKVVAATARELGKDVSLPGISAKDAALAMVELAKAGLSVNDTMAASKGVLSLAKAGQVDTAFAAEVTANALNAFSLSGKEANRVADMLSGGANGSSASIQDLALGMQMASASAATLQMPIDDLISALGLMSNNALKGSDAGTSLKTFMNSLTPVTDRQVAAMEAMNLQFFDAKGNFVGLRDAAKQLQVGTKGMTTEQKLYNMEAAFGSDAMRSAMILAKEGAAGYDNMSKSVTKQGAATELAAAQNAGFKGSLDALQSSLETVGIDLGMRMLPSLTKLVNGLTDKVEPSFDALIGTAEEFTNVLRNFGSNAIGYLQPKLEALGMVVSSRLTPVLTELWSGVIQPLIPVIAVALVGALGLAIDSIRIVADSVGWLVQAFNDGNPVVIAMAGALTGLAAALAFNSLFNALSVGIATLSLVTIPGAMASIGALVGVLTGPGVASFLVIGAAIALLVGAFVYLQKKYDIVGKTWGGLQSLGKGIGQAWDGAVSATKQAGDFFNTIPGTLSAVWDAVVGGGQSALDSVMSVVSAIPGHLSRAGAAIAAGVQYAAQAVSSWLLHLPQDIAYAIGFLVGRLIYVGTVAIPTTIATIAVGLWLLPGKMAAVGAAFWAVATSWFSRTGEAMASATMAGVNAVGVWFTQLPGRASAAASQMWGAVTGWFTRTGQSMQASSMSAVNGTSTWFQQLPGRVGGALGSLWSAASAKLTAFKDSFMGWAQGVVDSVVGTFMSLPDRIGSAISGAVESAKNAIGDLGSSAMAGFQAGFSGPQHAMGTLYAPGGMTMVGERGPELVRLPQGSQVTQAYRTRSMMQEGGGDGGTTNILSGTFNFANAEASNAFWDRIDKTQRLARMGMAS